ncbi:MAG: hypothetical protein ACP5OX_02245 [Minisyncoccia bacterium]
MAKESFSTQSLIPIQEIKKGIIILKNGSLRSVLEVSGINTDLKSSDEQMTILNAWRQLLNHLEFSFEVTVLSIKVNIDSYLNFLQEQISKETNELLKIQGEDYTNFLSALISENAIMAKRFFIVIPYDPVIIKSQGFLGQVKDTLKGIINLKRESFSNINVVSNEEFENYYQQLMIRQTGIVSALNRIGLEVKPLTTKELIEIFFNLYNPSLEGGNSLSLEETE